MPKRKESTITSRTGINNLRTIVENSGSIFNEIHQENDVGIDVIVELFSDQQPINKLVAFQIKSGASFYDEKRDQCIIPVDNHFDYWLNYSIPVYGFVFVPALKQGYWVDIKAHLESNGRVSVIRFTPKTINALSEEYFANVFSPLAVKQLPNISFEDGERLMLSSHKDEVAIGLNVLFKKFANENRAWERITNFFRETRMENIPSTIIHYLAHIPWHPDIHYDNESYTNESKYYARELISRFNIEEIVKLIRFIDEENLIARGTPGQSVKAIVSIIKNADEKLFSIVTTHDLDLHIRAVAAILYAYVQGPNINEVKQCFNEDEPWFVHIMIDTIVEDPEFMPR